MSSSIFVYICLIAIVCGGSQAQQRMEITDNIYGGVDATNNGGTLATLGAKANLFKNDDGQRLDARAQASQHFNPNGPIQYGLGMDYNERRGGASVDVTRAQGMGTILNTEGRANLFESRDHRTRLDATANYQQRFGPQPGRDYGAGLRFTHAIGK